MKIVKLYREGIDAKKKACVNECKAQPDQVKLMEKAGWSKIRPDDQEKETPDGGGKGTDPEKDKKKVVK